MDYVTFKEHWKRIVLGWFFLIFGVLGLFLPVLQGILFLLMGVMLLSPYIPLLRKGQLAMYRRFPKIGRQVVHLKRKHAHRLARKAG